MDELYEAAQNATPLRVYGKTFARSGVLGQEQWRSTLSTDPETKGGVPWALATVDADERETAGRIAAFLVAADPQTVMALVEVYRAANDSREFVTDHAMCAGQFKCSLCVAIEKVAALG
jgi:hypothetical protein